MKILLIKPPSALHQVIPPIGLGYLAGSLKGHDTKIIDCVRDKIDHITLSKIIEKEKPDAVGVTVFSVDLMSAKKCCDIAKNADEKIMTILGGAHISGNPEESMSIIKTCDIGIIGEGENAVQMLLDGKPLEKINNVVWRRGNDLIINKKEVEKDLDSLSCRWDLLEPEKYGYGVHGGFAKRFPVAPVMTSRGCPYGCTFCAGHAVTGKKIRLRSVGKILDEIELLVGRGIREIHIEDDNFTFYKERVMDFCKGLLERNLDITWCCPNGVRLDTLDDEMLEWMKRSGCYSLSVGVESGSERILKHMKKNLTKEKIEEKIMLIKRHGIQTIGFFIVGYPEETERDILETIGFAKKLSLDRAQFSIFMPLPGSEIYEKLKGEGKINNIEWDKFISSKVAYTEKISEKDLKKLQKKAYLDFYLRTRIIFSLIREIKSLKHSEQLLVRIKDYMLS